MPLLINSNIVSLNAQRQMSLSEQGLSTSLERLSSGKRINSAADDAAGLSIANRMNSQVRGLSQAVRNALDGVSMIQVAEGALQETTNLLQRMRELAVQAANGIYSDTDRATLDAEVQQLVQEVSRIADTTSFNGQSLLGGDPQGVALQVGAEAGQSITFNIPAMDANTLGLSSGTEDLLGGALDLNTAGGLSRALAAGAIKINGQHLSSLAAGSPLQALLDDINQNIAGVSARSVVSITAPSTGDGLLQGADSLVITGIGLDGVSQSFEITNTGSLDALVDAINLKTGSLLSASINDNGRLQLTSDRFATLSLQDTSNGSATGVNQTEIADPDIAEVIEGLTTNWISQAENMISTYFGISGDGVDLTLDLTFTDGPSNAAARVTAVIPGLGGLGSNLTLDIDMADFSASGVPSGGTAPNYMDRIIAHEMVHAVMYRNTNMLNSAMPNWFAEGTAEFIHGADERVKGDVAAGFLDNQAELSAAFATGKLNNSITAVGYSAGYIAVKMLHQDIIDAGGTGIAEVMTELASGDDLSTALGDVAGARGIGLWSDLTAFETRVDTDGYAFLQLGYNGLDDALNFDAGTELDTGSIAGSDYGGLALTAETVVNNSATGPAQDFNLIIPTAYSGGLTSADARLVLSSDTNDAIEVSLGGNGSDTDLSLLGLRELSTSGTLQSASLTATAQAAALGTGDLLINGVEVAAVAAGSGLQAKIDAINAVTDATQVFAATRAQQSFAWQGEATLEYTTAGSLNIANPGVLGINGIGVAVDANDSAREIAAAVNALHDYHGATAYADSQGSLHLFSETTLNLSAPPALGAELALSNGNLGEGSINLNGTELTFADITDQNAVITTINSASGISGVSAAIDANGELRLTSSAAIKIKLGDLRGLQTLERLGISFGTAGSEQLTDTDNDELIDDEVFVINPGIQLQALAEQNIRIEVTAEGEAATGLTSFNEDDLNGGFALANITIASQAGAVKALRAIDQAMETINDARAQLGAVNNRLEFTISNLTTVIEKTAAARARIEDADYAMETAKLSRAQVLMQASQAMLAQANARPQQVLQLLN